MKKVFESYKHNETGGMILAAPIREDAIPDIFNELRDKFGIDDITIDIGKIVIRPTDKNGEKYELKIAFTMYGLVYLVYDKTLKRFYGLQEVQLLLCYTKVFDINIKYFSNEIEKLRYIDGKSDWIDLRAAKEVELKAGEFKLIPLGIAMELPNGYEAHVVPRSSTYKNFGIIEANSMGIIDETYCGNNDQWFFPALAFRDTIIRVNDRICQFRIQEHQPPILFNEVDKLDNPDRGGHGSTGKQ